MSFIYFTIKYQKTFRATIQKILRGVSGVRESTMWRNNRKISVCKKVKFPWFFSIKISQRFIQQQHEF